MYNEVFDCLPTDISLYDKDVYIKGKKLLYNAVKRSHVKKFKF